MIPESAQQLRRAIRLPHATAMVVGTIIGASIFVQPSEISGRVSSIAGVLLVWTVSGVLTLFGALVCAELSSIFARTGGVYVYLKEAFSPAVGFLWGWAMFWTMHSGIIAVIAMVFARYLAWFFPDAQPLALGLFGEGELTLELREAFAVLAVVLLSAVNYVGVRHGSVLQTLFTLGKVGAIAFVILAGFILGARLPGHGASSSPAATGIQWGDFGLALVAGLFAFGGWHMVTYNSEETVEPRRTIPRALILGTLIVTACYFAMNAVYLYVLPLETVASSERIAADAADRLLGRGGGAFMSSLVVFSTFGSLSGIILAGPRVYFAMARDGLLFRWIGAVHPRFQTPHRAIVLQAVWSSVLVLTGSYRALFSRVIYTEWIFFGLLAVALFLFRRRADLKREYSIPGFPVVPVVFMLSAFLVVGNHVATDILRNGWITEAGMLNESATGLLLVLGGLPVYALWTRVHRGRG